MYLPNILLCLQASKKFYYSVFTQKVLTLTIMLQSRRKLKTDACCKFRISEAERNSIDLDTNDVLLA